jgi:lysyl oxidase
MRRCIVVLALVGGLMLALASSAVAGPADASTAGPALYPDIRTVVPQHVQLVNAGQKETLRFSNGVANSGPGPWALGPDPSLEVARELGLSEVGAVQEIRDSNAYYECGTQPQNISDCFNIIDSFLAGEFVFHPAHNHWHIGDVALFEIRKGSPTGRIVGGNSIKTTFCLIDWYQLDGKSPNTGERAFFDCYHSYQGVSSGWVDQYHQSTEGQQLDLTGVPNANDYYLVSTANYARRYLELDYTNNTAWVKFTLSSDSKGNRKVTVTGHSPCVMGSGLCGENTTNR